MPNGQVSDPHRIIIEFTLSNWDIFGYYDQNNFFLNFETYWLLYLKNTTVTTLSNWHSMIIKLSKNSKI